MNTKERILQFVDFKQISKREFCKKSGLSHTIFNNNSAIGSDKLEKICNIFDELNMDWVITGRGEMLYKEPESVAEWKEKYYKLLEMKITVVEPASEELKKASNVVAFGHTDELSQVAEPAIEIKKVE
jgi:hypothetical protein